MLGLKRERDSPVAHRTRGIEFDRGLERSNRLAVVERIRQREALIEVALRLGDALVISKCWVPRLPKIGGRPAVAVAVAFSGVRPEHATTATTTPTDITHLAIFM
jgi:hypothetical protein